MTLWGESSSPGYHTAWSQSRRGYHTPGSHRAKCFFKSPQGPWGVKLTGVAYPGESISPGYATLGSQQQFLNTFSQAFKGTVAQK